MNALICTFVNDQLNIVSFLSYLFLPGESPGWMSLVGYSPWGRKELDTTERLHFTSLQGFLGSSDDKVSAYNAGDPGSIPGREDPLEKEMATHSSILAWRISWMEEPGGLQYMGSERVGHY